MRNIRRWLTIRLLNTATTVLVGITRLVQLIQRGPPCL